MPVTEKQQRLTPRARRRFANRDGSPSPPSDPPLADLGISGRFHEDLGAAGITRLSQLESCGELTQIKGIGPKAASEIQRAVETYRTTH